MDSGNNVNLTYEQALVELQKIIEALSSGKVALDDALKYYNRGVELTNFCDNKLKEVEQKITVIRNGSEENFNIEEDGSGANG